MSLIQSFPFYLYKPPFSYGPCLSTLFQGTTLSLWDKYASSTPFFFFFSLSPFLLTHIIFFSSLPSVSLVQINLHCAKNFHLVLSCTDTKPVNILLSNEHPLFSQSMPCVNRNFPPFELDQKYYISIIVYISK